MTTTKHEQRLRRHRKVRVQIRGIAACPRLTVFRSNIHIYGQVIDDTAGRTLAASSDLVIKAEKKEKNALARVADAYAVGFDLAKRAKAAGVERVVFDRGGYRYMGRVKSLADGARAGGLQF